MNDEIEILESNITSAASSIGEATSQLQSEVVKSAQEKIDSFTRGAVDRYQKVQQATRQRIIEKPGISIAVIASASFILGILLGRRRSPNP